MIDQLSEANRRLEQMMEENAGLHAQLVAQAREAGVFDERQRMAGEIHDTLAQGLMGILAQLEAAELAATTPVANGGSRQRAGARQPGRGTPLGAGAAAAAAGGGRLPEALRELAGWTATIRVAGEVDGGAARPLQPALEVAVPGGPGGTGEHRQARERHAAGMTLTYMHDVVSLDVLDDGAGFSAATSRTVNGNQTKDSNGYGLAAMRQRLRQVGGGLEIESAPGDGTTVSASVPALYR